MEVGIGDFESRVEGIVWVGSVFDVIVNGKRYKYGFCGSFDNVEYRLVE